MVRCHASQFLKCIDLQSQAPSLDVEYVLFERQKLVEIAKGSSETVMALQRIQMEELKVNGENILLRVKEKQVRICLTCLNIAVAWLAL